MKPSRSSTLCKIWPNQLVRIETARIDFLFYVTFWFKITYGGCWGSLSFKFSHRWEKISPGDCKNIFLRRILSLAKFNCWTINKKVGLGFEVTTQLALSGCVTSVFSSHAVYSHETNKSKRFGLNLHAISRISTAANRNGYPWVAKCCCRRSDCVQQHV